MAKKKLSYPKDRPNSIQEISKSFIEEYFSFEVEKGNISVEALENWIKIVEAKEKQFKEDTPVKAFNAYREEFVKLYMPHLVKLKTASDFYATLLAKAKQAESKSEAKARFEEE